MDLWGIWDEWKLLYTGYGFLKNIYIYFKKQMVYIPAWPLSNRSSLSIQDPFLLAYGKTLGRDMRSPICDLTC